MCAGDERRSLSFEINLFCQSVTVNFSSIISGFGLSIVHTSHFVNMTRFPIAFVLATISTTDPLDEYIFSGRAEKYSQSGLTEGRVHGSPR
jgi:hypothetical protein